MISIQVRGMTCGHCVNAVTQAIQSIDDNAKVAVSLADNRVDIESAATLAQFRDAIEAAGYEVPAAAN